MQVRSSAFRTSRLTHSEHGRCPAVSWRCLRGDRAIRLATFGAVVGIATALVWVLATAALNNVIVYPDPTLTGSVAALESWRMTWTRLEQLVGVLGWLDTPLPDALWQFWGVVAAALCLLALWRGRWRHRLTIGAMLIGVVALPVVIETLTASRTGLIWQGRYSLPVVVGAVLLSGHALADVEMPSWLEGARRAIAVGLGGCHLVAHLSTMTRYSLGYDAGLTDYLRAPGWAGPLPDVGLLGLTATAAAGVVGLLWLARYRTAVQRSRTSGHHHGSSAAG